MLTFKGRQVAKPPSPISSELPAYQRLFCLEPPPLLPRYAKSGMYDTAFSCEDDVIEKLGLSRLYANREEIDGCNVFWSKRTK